MSDFTIPSEVQLTVQWSKTRVILSMAVLILVTSNAKARHDSPRCWLTKENRPAIPCSRKLLPKCIWKDWQTTRHAKPEGGECMYSSCQYEGDFSLTEVDLDGNHRTREFILRRPDVPREGTADKSFFEVIQAKNARCAVVMRGNGTLTILQARSHGYRRLFHDAHTGGPFCYTGLHAWNGKEYVALTEGDDAPCTKVGEIRAEQGPAYFTEPRPTPCD